MKKVNPKSLAACFIVMLCLTGLTIAQALELPADFEQDYEILSEHDGLLVYRNRLNGLTQMKQVVLPENQGKFSQLDTLYADTVYTFKVWEIDTSQYTGMFRKMGEVPVNNRSYDMLLTDTDGNTRKEIIGKFHPNDASAFLPTYYYEWSPITQNFVQVADFNPTPGTSVGVSVLSGDIDNDSRNEIYYLRGHWIRAYESSDTSQYATEFRYRHEPFEGIIPSGFAMADFDLDNRKELAFLRVLIDSAGIARNGCIIRENSGCDTCFTETASVLMPNSAGTTRFAVGDLNGNGRPEIFGGGLFGLMTAIESVADDSFSVIWQGQLPTFNADYHLVTADLNRNGKPELWAGGGHGLSVTKNLVSVLESDGQGGYLPVSAVEIQGGNGIYIWQMIAADLDGDNHDEVILDVGGTVLILKLTERNEILLQWAAFVAFDYGIGAGDVDGDTIDELVLAENIRDGHTIITKSTIYKWKSPVAIQPLFENHNNTTVLDVFPNPFNPTTTFAFALPESLPVRLTIFDLTGRQVAELINEELPAGRYEIPFDASNLASGVYLYRMAAGQSFTQTRKMMLIK